MSTHHEFYLERATEARRDASNTPLQNVETEARKAAVAELQVSE